MVCYRIYQLMVYQNSLKKFYNEIFKKSEEAIKTESEQTEEGEEEKEESNLPSLYEVGDMVSYKGTDLKVTEVESDTISAKDEKGEEHSNIPMSDINKKDEEDDDENQDKSSLIKKHLKRYRKAYNDLLKYCEKCDPNNRKLKHYKSQIEGRLESEIHEDKWSDDGRNPELERFIKNANEVCKSCELPDNTPQNEEIRNSLLNSFSLVLEKGELSVRGERGLSNTEKETGLSTTGKSETGLVKNDTETGMVKFSDKQTNDKEDKKPESDKTETGLVKVEKFPTDLVTQVKEEVKKNSRRISCIIRRN